MNRPSPDPQGRDDDDMEQSEMLDEDDLGVDPLEAGMDPPQGWSAADRYGTTATEQATDRPLQDRLGEEVPDRPAKPASGEGQVLVGEEADRTGESATRRAGHLVAEPDQPALDETAVPREE